jgi:hypothetical protein
MALNAASLLCPFIVASNIFTPKKDTSKTHYNNTELNVLDNAPLVGHWLVMGFKTNKLPVDAQLSKMETTIENIASLVADGNLAIN